MLPIASFHLFVWLFHFFQYLRINRQNDIILNAQRTVADTEEVGLEITNELSKNREKIQSSQSKVGWYDRRW